MNHKNKDFYKIIIEDDSNISKEFDNSELFYNSNLDDNWQKIDSNSILGANNCILKIKQANSKTEKYFFAHKSFVWNNGETIYITNLTKIEFFRSDKKSFTIKMKNSKKIDQKDLFDVKQNIIYYEVNKSIDNNENSFYEENLKNKYFELQAKNIFYLVEESEVY